MEKRNPKPLLVVICGPTASGKTALSVALARHFGSIVISADSRQFFREMPIGTAAPTPDEQAGVPHYFVQHLSVHEPYNASAYAADVISLTDVHFGSNPIAFLVGGSGLYISAVCDGMDDLPDPDPVVRDLINSRLRADGIDSLRQWLLELDPDFYHKIDLSNHKRLQRALEVCLITGKPYSAQRTAIRKERAFDVLKIGLDWPRQELFDRIAQRTDAMIEQGLVEEVASLRPFRHLNALQTVGYRELFRFLDDEISIQQAVTDIKTNTRRYAKRQLTWFQRDALIRWFHPGASDQIVDVISKQLIAR